MTSIFGHGSESFTWSWGRISKKINRPFGTEDRVLQLLADGQTEIIAEVEGVSQKRADNLARSLNGIEDFLATPESVRLHKELIASIAQYALNP